MLRQPFVKRHGVNLLEAIIGCLCDSLMLLLIHACVYLVVKFTRNKTNAAGNIVERNCWDSQLETGPFSSVLHNNAARCAWK